MGRHKQVSCEICSKVMRSDHLKNHMKKHVDLSLEDSEQICKSILEDFINDIYNKDVVPIETYNHVSQQCQGWSSAYKKI